MTQIVIPMSGLGERFSRAGYTRPKPLIEVDGRAMISYVVQMFAPEDRFLFIVNHAHLNETNLAEILHKAAPACEIISIDTHDKGPVYAVSQCFDRINPDEETIVNYCDFYSQWNYQDFLADTRERKAAGAIAAYRDFHPHMLGSDNYAFIKEHDRWLEAIQEKLPFTDNRMAEFASNGTYYFARGQYVQHYFAELIKRGEKVKGEFYVSMVYNLMVADGLPVSIYEIEHMLQWGTPKDLEEYQHWSNYFTNLTIAAGEKDLSSTADLVLIPMAGRGQRFVDAGYTISKPLITVCGKPMVQLACDNLPAGKRYIFVALEEHLRDCLLGQVLKSNFPEVSIVALDTVSDGQAVSCRLGLELALPPASMDDSLLIGACDNGIIYDPSKWQTLLEDQSIEVAAFSFRHHPSSQRNPHMFGWLVTSGRASGFPLIQSVSVKKAISSKPEDDHAIVGAFFFRRAGLFMAGLTTLIDRDIRVNGEFYVDSIINVLAQAGHKCVAFEVDDYISFGIPDDLKTFEYWQSFFDKCAWHPYTKGLSA